MRLIGKVFAGSSGSSVRRSYLSVRHSSHHPEDGGWVKIWRLRTDLAASAGRHRACAGGPDSVV